MKIKYHLAALLIVTTLVTACSKEDKIDETNGTNSGSNCKLSKAYVYGEYNSVPYIDTLVYTYTDTSVSKITAHDYYLSFEYTGGRITRRNYFDGITATTSSDYETITYNSDGTVSKVELYSKDGTELEERYEFAYNAGKLMQLTHNSYYWNGAATDYSDTHFYTYTGNNITRDSVIDADAYDTSSQVYYYTYDAQENHFKKAGANALFQSAIFLDGIYGEMLPFFFSANNVTAYREDLNGEDTKFSYTLDSNKNLNAINVDGMPGALWEYQCP